MQDELQGGLLVKGSCTTEFADFCSRNGIDCNATSLTRVDMTRIIVAYIKDNNLRTGRNIINDAQLTILNGGQPLLHFDKIQKMLNRNFIRVPRDIHGEAKEKLVKDDSGKESVKDRSIRKIKFWDSSEVQNFLKKEIEKAYPKEWLPVWLTNPDPFYKQMASELCEALWIELEGARPYRPDCFTCFDFDFSLVPTYIQKRRPALSDKFGTEFEIPDDVYDAYVESGQ